MAIEWLEVGPSVEPLFSFSPGRAESPECFLLRVPEAVWLELVLDFRRLRCLIARLMRFAVVHDVVVSSESSDELLDESEELFINSARTPG